MTKKEKLISWFKNWNCTWDNKTNTFTATRDLPCEEIIEIRSPKHHLCWLKHKTSVHPNAEVDWNWNDNWYGEKNEFDIIPVEDYILIASIYVEKAKYSSDYHDDNKKIWINEAEYWIQEAEKKLNKNFWINRKKYYTEKYFN